MKRISQGSSLTTGLLVLCLGSATFTNHAKGALVGTVPLLPTQTVVPGLVPPGTAAGTLLADLTVPFSFTTTAGTTDGTIISAVYRESGGSLDFYYQVDNSTNSATSVARETSTSFAGWTTDVGYRVDGSTLAGTGFIDGTMPPITADSNSTASTIGFNFDPPVTARINPGLSSNVLVISTNAPQFTAGNVSVIDGGAVTVSSFQPVPEPAALAACALLGSLLMRRRSA